MKFLVPILAANLAVLGSHAVLAQDSGSEEPMTLVSYPEFSHVVIPGAEVVTEIIEARGDLVSSDVLLEQVAVGNVIVEADVDRAAAIVDSGVNIMGIVQINVESGNANNQANIVSIAGSENAGGVSVAMSDILGRRELRGNTVIASGSRETRVEGSFNNTMGIAQANVAAGNLDQQVNAVALSIGLNTGPAVIALGDAILGEVGTSEDNVLVEDPTSTRQDTMTDSFNGFHGIGQVNQTSGDLVRSSNLLSVNVTVWNVP